MEDESFVERIQLSPEGITAARVHYQTAAEELADHEALSFAIKAYLAMTREDEAKLVAKLVGDWLMTQTNVPVEKICALEGEILTRAGVQRPTSTQAEGRS